MQKRLDFDSDLRSMERGNKLAHDFAQGTGELLAKYEDDLRNIISYQSKHNADLFAEYFAIYAKVIENLNGIKTYADSSRKNVLSMGETQQKFIAVRQSLVDEFAEIERKLAEELKDANNAGISSGVFLNLKSKLAQTTQSLTPLAKQGNVKDIVSLELTKLLNTLNEL